MRFLIVGDLHGQIPKIHFKDFDAIIAPGDFCSDEFVRPYYKKYFALLKKGRRNVPSQDEFFRQELGDKKLREMDSKSLEIGRSVLEFLNSFEVPVFIVPGNWDQSYGKTDVEDLDIDLYHYRKAFLDFENGSSTNPKITRGLKNLVDCQLALHTFKGIDVIGYGLSSGPEDPRASAKLKNSDKLTPGEFRRLVCLYKKQLNRLSDVYRKNHTPGNSTIFLTHNIPYDTNLDIVLDKKSYVYKRHLGSSLARAFCQRHQPLVCIGGHIHDYFGKDFIGGTTVLNAGFGQDKNILLEIEEGQIKNLEFFSVQ